MPCSFCKNFMWFCNEVSVFCKKGVKCCGKPFLWNLYGKKSLTLLRQHACGRKHSKIYKRKWKINITTRC